MKKLLTPLLAIFLIACSNDTDKKEPVQNSAEKTQIMKNEEKQNIEKLLEVYKNALNTSDAKLAQSLYTKDGVFMPAQAPSAVGLEDILASYSFIFSQIKLTVEFNIEEIKIDGNIAFATTSSKGTVNVIATNQTNPEENRELFVFQKEDGQWKIARYMFNKIHPAS